jgi:hypothetical protein
MANPLDYNVNRQIQGVSGFGRQFPTIIYSATLAGSTEEHFTIPSSSVIGGMNSTYTNPRYLIVFGYKQATEFWVAINATAAVPAGGTFASSTAELLPSAYEVKAGDVVSVISAAGGDISISIYGMLGA